MTVREELWRRIVGERLVERKDASRSLDRIVSVRYANSTGSILAYDQPVVLQGAAKGPDKKPSRSAIQISARKLADQKISNSLAAFVFSDFGFSATRTKSENTELTTGPIRAGAGFPPPVFREREREILEAQGP